MNNEIKEKYELAIKYLKGIEIEQNFEVNKKTMTAKELFGIE